MSLPAPAAAQADSSLLLTMALPLLARSFASTVDPVITETDAMLGTQHAAPREHYFSVGASALNCILAATALGKLIPKTILDFGCGAGRVTRWLRAAFPVADISACDLREQDLMFVRERFQAQTWISGTDVANLELTRQFDLIWLGSVVTHLNEATSIVLLRKLFSWLTPQGLLVVSLHGPSARAYGDAGTPTYLHPEGWQQVKDTYDATGYGYADYVSQQGYGISLASPQWTVGLLGYLEGARIVMFGEAMWDNHHDVVALKRRDAQRRSFGRPGAEAVD